MLIEAQKEDLELYDRVRQEIYPTYQKEYGSSLQSDVTSYQHTQSTNFNYWNLTMSRMKHYMLYNPLLYLNRKGVKVA